MIHQCKIKSLGHFGIADPRVGDFKLNVFPILHFPNNVVKLPIGFEIWNDSVNALLKHVPFVEGANLHYITIDSKFFSTPEFLRREGVHADGNFCVDPNFTFASWGGTTWADVKIEEDEDGKRTWGGTKISPRKTWGGTDLVESNEEGVSYVEWQGRTFKVTRDWAVPYDLHIPVGDYITSKKGGLFCVSTAVGCQAWQGEFYGEVGSEGNYDEMLDQLTEDKKVLFEANQLYFMTSNTPHESLLIQKGVRRTFMRLTLNHEYPNTMLPCMQEEKVFAF